MAQKTDLYQALDAQIILQKDQFNVGFGVFMGFVDSNKKLEYYPTSSFKRQTQEWN